MSGELVVSRVVEGIRVGGMEGMRKKRMERIKKYEREKVYAAR
jgi:hypothetical protein